MSQKLSLHYILLILILLIGSFLRFYKIERDSLWFDELGTWETARSDITLTKNPLNTYSFNKHPVTPLPDNILKEFGIIAQNAHTDRVHLPLYFYFIYLMKKWFGDSPLSMRFLSVLSGILSIAMIYGVARELYNRNTALVSAAIMSFMWFPVYYCREARMYIMMVLFTLISCYFYIRLYKELKYKSKIRLWIAAGYLSASLINAYLHFYTFYFSVLQSISFFILFFWVIKCERKNRILIGLILAIQLFCLLPVIRDAYFLLIDSYHIPNIEWVLKRKLKIYNFFIPFNSFLNYPIDDLPVFPNPFMPKTAYQKPYIWLGAILLILYFIFRQYDYCIINRISLGKWFKNLFKTVPNSLAVAGWLIIPNLIIFMISIIKIPLYIDRYLIFTLPPLYILLAHILQNLHHKAVINHTVTLLFLSLILVDLFVWKNLYNGINVMQANEPIAYIADHPLQDGKAFAASNTGNFGLEYYMQKYRLTQMPLLDIQVYYREPIRQIRDIQYPAGTEKEVQTFLNTIDSGEYRYFWYINMFAFTPLNDIKAFSDFKQILKIDFYYTTLYLYRI